MSASPPTVSTPQDARQDALAVVRRLRDAGHVAYFAGGCVRDALLGLEPKDYDVATDATPDRVRELFRRTQAVGVAFGVILVRQGRSQIEVATFRSDLKYVDGRRPQGVVFTTADEDAKRRDFTINGLFFDPIDDKVIDFVGGQEDLKTKTLRAIGDPNERFAEDHLRLLRAVRFAARFGLEIEQSTRDAITHHAAHLARISPERIAEELRLMLTPPTRAAAWHSLVSYGLDDIAFRFVDFAGRATHPETSSIRPGIFERVCPGAMIPFGLALAAASIEFVASKVQASSLAPLRVDAIDFGVVKALRQSLRISNDELDVMEATLSGVNYLLCDPSPGVATLKRFLARPTSRHSRDLIAALPQDWVPQRDEVERRLRDLEKSDYAPPPLITGDDLTAAGLAPSRAFKQALDAAYDAQLENRVTTKDQALELALGIARGG